MASKLKVDQIEGQSGTSVEVPTGHTLKVADLGNNKILSTNSSGVVTATSFGSASQKLRMNSSADALEFFTEASVTQDFVKLGSASATGSSSAITIDNLFTSDYDIYKIYYTRMNPVSGIDHTQFRMRLLDASGSVITSSNYKSSYIYYYFNASSNSQSTNRHWGQDYIRLHQDHIGQASDNNKSHEAEITIYNPLSTSYKTSFDWRCNADDGGGGSEYEITGRGWIDDSAIANRGVQIYTYDGDNIDANAKIICYGIKH